MPETVTYRSLQDVVVRAGRLFPDTQFFLSKAPAMPYVLGRDLPPAITAMRPPRPRVSGTVGSTPAISAGWTSADSCISRGV